MKTKASNKIDPAAQTNFQTLDEFQRAYFPHDSKDNASEVDSSEALIRELAQQSAVIIKAAFAKNK